MAAEPAVPRKAAKQTAAAPFLLTNREGQSKAFTPGQVKNAYASGLWTAPTGTHIPVWDNGKTRLVPLREILDPENSNVVPLSLEDYNKAQEQEKYGHVYNYLEAAATNAVKGVPFAGPGAIALLPKGVREHAEHAVHANPISAGAGTVASFLGQMAAGGASELGEVGALGAEGAEAAGAARAIPAAAEALAPAAEALAPAAEAIVPAAEASGAARAIPAAAETGEGLASTLQAATPEAAQAAEAAHIADVAGAAEAAGVDAEGLASLEAGNSTLPGYLRRGLAAPMNAITKVDDLAEAGVRKLLGNEATSLAAKLALKSASLGARGAVEGGLRGASDYLGETALSQDQELDGQKLWSEVKHGMLLGGGLGAGLGAVEAAGARALEGVSLGRIGKSLENTSGELAVNAITGGRGLKAAQEISELPGGKRELGKVLVRKGIAGVGDSAVEMLPKITAWKKDAGAAVDAIREEAGVEGPRISTLKDLITKVSKPLEKYSTMNPAPLAALRKIQTNLDELANAAIDKSAAEVPKTSEELASYFQSPEGKTNLQDLIAKNPEREEAIRASVAKGEIPVGLFENANVANPRMSFREVAEFRSAIDKNIKDFGKSDVRVINQVGEALKKSRGIIEDELEKQMGKVASKTGNTDLLKRYRDAKIDFRQAAAANKAAYKASQAIATNRGLSLSDMIAGGAVGAGHLALGGSGVFTGLLTAAAHRIVRQRGSSTAAVLLDKIATMGAVQKATERFDRRVAQYAEAAVAGKAVEAPKPTHGLDTFAEQKAAVEEAVKNLQEHSDSVSNAASKISQHAPLTHKSFSDTAVRATLYLANALPKEHPSNIYQPLVNPIQPSKHQEHEFQSIFRAINEPTSLLADVANYAVVPAAVAAVGAVSPKVLDHMQKAVMVEMAKSEKPMTMQQLTQLSMLVQKTLSPNLHPQAVGGYQVTFQSTGGKAPGRAQKGAAPSPERNKPSRAVKGIAEAHVLTGQHLSH
jgi:hypothetical protein